MGYNTIASGPASTALENGVEATGNGELYNSGEVKASVFTSTSDRQVKRNIKPFTNALDKVLKLVYTRTYMYNVEEFPRFESQKDKAQIGFIAQEVENVRPELVSTDGDDVALKGVRTYQLTLCLWKLSHIKHN